MNVSVIADMIRADPSIVANQAAATAFAQAMNLNNVPTSVDVKTVVTTVLGVSSIAKINGGPCTAADIQAAVALVNSKQFSDRVPIVMAAVQSQIDSGAVDTLAKLKAAFSAAVTALT